MDPKRGLGLVWVISIWCSVSFASLLWWNGKDDGGWWGYYNVLANAAKTSYTHGMDMEKPFSFYLTNSYTSFYFCTSPAVLSSGCLIVQCQSKSKPLLAFDFFSNPTKQHKSQIPIVY